MLRAGQLGGGLRFQLATAYLETGNDAEAAVRLERIVNGGILRANNQPNLFARPRALGRMSEGKGDRNKAGDYYRRRVVLGVRGER